MGGDGFAAWERGRDDVTSPRDCDTRGGCDTDNFEDLDVSYIALLRTFIFGTFSVLSEVAVMSNTIAL
jgi:hypothetical protein